MVDTVKIILIVVAVLAVASILAVSIKTDGLTGGTIIKKVSCYNDHDCDDHNSLTEDFCKNSGTEGSLCVNKLMN
ncbi:hypothetical protein COY27_02480 [Candidatus Woesearchaeota archaeon CG_4_10_14_0_2_um_filter_33_13]|nr:MAG: hypothetical protein COY27_02480 [Candidatus Woesearchaeota archaeon CG_4_10_14_0_2_um_filter_33_13]